MYGGRGFNASEITQGDNRDFRDRVPAATGGRNKGIWREDYDDYLEERGQRQKTEKGYSGRERRRESSGRDFGERDYDRDYSERGRDYGDRGSRVSRGVKRDLDRDQGGRESDYENVSVGRLSDSFEYGGRDYDNDIRQYDTPETGGYGYAPIRKSRREAPTDLGWYSGWWRPRSDILEEGDNFIVEFELPGVPKETISLSVSQDHVVLSTVKPQSNKERRGYYYQNERHFGNFFRRLQLPDRIDTAGVHALYDNGVLKVTLPKSETGEGISRRRIPIELGDLPGPTATGTTATTSGNQSSSTTIPS